MAMNDTKRVPTPTLDEQAAIQGKAAIASELLDFLDEHGLLRTENCADFNKLLQEFFEIDGNKIEAERQAILDTINLPEGQFVVPEHCK